MFSKIISSGSYLPKKILTNKDLEKIVNTSDEWITTRTGIKKRHISENQTTSEIAYLAGLNAINNSSISKDEIDMIIVATTTPDLIFPSTATKVQNLLGIKNSCAFDIQAVCSGFIYAISVADKFIKTASAKNILVIGADTLSKIVNWKDRNTCVLFGDGAGAVILAQSKDQKSGIINTKLNADGKYIDILKTTGGVSKSNIGFIEMNGKEVFKHAVEKMTASINEILLESKLTVNDIDWLIPHQANTRILSHVVKKISLPSEKAVITVDQHGNTSAASIPLALETIKHKIKPGDKIVMVALGAGLTWGSILIEW